jgi:hypothetical protein
MTDTETRAPRSTAEPDTRRGPDGLLRDPDAARAEARRGWIMLTQQFVGGAVLVALAALVT